MGHTSLVDVRLDLLFRLKNPEILILHPDGQLLANSGIPLMRDPILRLDVRVCGRPRKLVM